LEVFFVQIFLKKIEKHIPKLFPRQNIQKTHSEIFIQGQQRKIRGINEISGWEEKF
jgi:hypothetical protein